LNPEKLENLKKAISGTGFPLEMEVDRVLRSSGFHSSPSSLYIDDETEKQREIDNNTLFPDSTTARLRDFQPLGVSPNLLIECKKLGDVCITVFRRHQEAVTHHDFEGQMHDFPYLINQKARAANMIEDFHLGWMLANSRLHYSAFSTRIGVAKGIKPTTKTAETKNAEEEHDVVFQGLMQLVKAQAHSVTAAIARDSTISNQYYPFYFTFLALVVEGDIVEVDSDSTGGLSLTPVDHAVARMSFRPNYSNEVLGYLVDIISKDNFTKYLETLVRDIDSLSHKLDAEKSRLSQYLFRPGAPRLVPGRVLP
jgi:hypothetical protein